MKEAKSTDDGLKIRIEALKEFCKLAEKEDLKKKEIPLILAKQAELAAIFCETNKPIVEWQENKQPLDLTNPEEIPKDLIIQNRDRSVVASRIQMSAIAANPDYLRLSGSNSFGEGAPVIAYGNIPKNQMGKISEAFLPDGTKIKTQYAVIDVSKVLTSNDINGQKNDEFFTSDPSKPRAIAGNGRLTGLREAYLQGKAGNYLSELKEDKSHGISSEIINKVPNAVLVRVMQPKDVTSDIGDKSNTRTNISLNKVETAKNDVNRLDVNQLELNGKGGLTVEAMNRFIAKLPLAEQAELIDNRRGQPNQECERRLMNATFINAYDVEIDGMKTDAADRLLEAKIESIDPDERVITESLYLAAPTLGRLKGLKGGYDIREIVVKAACKALAAKKMKNNNIKSESLVKDMFEEEAVTGAAALIMDIFDKNSRSSRKCAEGLIKIGEALLNQQESDDSSLFGGDQDKIPPDMVIKYALQKISESENQHLDNVEERKEGLTAAQRKFWNSTLAYMALDSIIRNTKDGILLFD